MQVKIQAKKVDGEWCAVVYHDGKRYEPGTYYAGDDKEDAVQTAEAMRAEARSKGHEVVR